MRSRDLIAGSRDLFVNFKDHLIIFDPTNGTSINSHLLLPINSPHGEEVGDFFGFLHICSLGLLSLFLRLLR